jgi:hypothetical protein
MRLRCLILLNHGLPLAIAAVLLYAQDRIPVNSEDTDRALIERLQQFGLTGIVEAKNGSVNDIVKSFTERRQPWLCSESRMPRLRTKRCFPYDTSLTDSVLGRFGPGEAALWSVTRRANNRRVPC